jgi:hypothetical protein
MIVGLTGLNLLLLAVLIVFNYAPPAAEAAARGRPGDYLLATIQVHEDYDAIAIVNVPRGAVHVFVPVQTGATAKLQFLGTRNLNSDFGRP